jgi:hypothetical protein
VSGELKTAPDGQPERERSSALAEIKGDTEKVDTWLKKVMTDGMDGVLNGPEVGGPCVPIEVERQIGKTWAG